MSGHSPPAHPVVGILGGMGPAATIDLMRRIMDATQAGDDADHIHLIVDQNPRVPSRIKALIERTGASPADELVRMAKNLEEAGATMLAIACNTAHAYAGAIAAAVSIPLLDMIELTAEEIAGRPLKNRRVGMLASTAVLQLGLYERAFGAHGIETRYPKPEEQEQVLDLIKAVKAGRVTELRGAFNRLARRFLSDDLDLSVVACTELSLLTDGLDAEIQVVDALDVLVSAIVRRAAASEPDPPAKKE
jgi:aspartate racemase